MCLLVSTCTASVVVDGHHKRSSASRCRRSGRRLVPLSLDETHARTTTVRIFFRSAGAIHRSKDQRTNPKKDFIHCSISVLSLLLSSPCCFQELPYDPYQGSSLPSELCQRQPNESCQARRPNRNLRAVQVVDSSWLWAPRLVPTCWLIFSPTLFSILLKRY